jgi:hypothetical protein
MLYVQPPTPDAC